jgi:murein L,D-transpeptidase YcbB/YkuD
MSVPRASRSLFPHFLFVLAAIVLAAGCTKREASGPSPDLQALVVKDARAAGLAVEQSVWADVQKFYEGRGHKLAWSTEEGPVDRAHSAVDTLGAAEAHGLDPAEYHKAELAAKLSELAVEAERTPARAKELAQFDLRVTSELLELGRHVASGRLKPTTIDARWNVKRGAIDYVAALQQASESDVAGLLDAVRPSHPEYAALQNALASLHGQKTSGWPAVPRASLKVGDWNQAVVPLRQRLAVSGYLSANAATDSAQFDADVAAAIQKFQEHHALKATGRLDPPTLAALNVPLDERIAQVALNLERWRWMPDSLGARHFIVNIPYFHLIARENGQPVLDIRIVVGKRGDETPVFSDEMTHVVFSPYWNVPESIAIEETAPAIARDPNYLSRNDMEVVNAAGRVVPESAIPWGDAAALSGLSFRQRPGASNALGLVKFMFPNRHSVYLHDTPADELFRRIGRAFSHGCVRVEEPEALAQYVLRDQSQWTPEAIHAAMRAGQERHVKLSQPIPVHIVYFTTWVDANGGVHFQPDVYGYDMKQSHARR